MCILLYVQLALVIVVVAVDLHVDWGEGWGQSEHGYMCMLLYMKPVWCNGSPEIYACMGGVTLAMGIYACCSM